MHGISTSAHNYYCNLIVIVLGYAINILVFERCDDDICDFNVMMMMLIRKADNSISQF